MKPKKEKFDPEWSECSTMEEWAEQMVKQGYIEIVQMMTNALPVGSKTKERLAKYLKMREERNKQR